MSSVVKDTVFFIDGCSAYSCDFGVLVRGGELRVFLCHLSLPTYREAFINDLHFSKMQ